MSAMFLSADKLVEMLEMQDAINRKVNPNWPKAGYPFLRAAMIEGAEAIEHYGWKWWKYQEPDMAQLRMELVDIWHFAMSDTMVKMGGQISNAAQYILNGLGSPWANQIDFDGDEYYLTDMDPLSRLDLLIGLAAARRFDPSLFEALLADCGMDWDDLYIAYIGKNVLNFFRQDNGYKTGSYQKVWAGREDNEHLAEILTVLNPANISFRNDVYTALQARYSALADAAA